MFDDSHVVFHFADAGLAADTSPTTVQIEATGATTLVQIGNNYFVSPTGGGPSVQLNAFGAPVFAMCPCSRTTLLPRSYRRPVRATLRLPSRSQSTRPC
jgi:hypothetical protein